MPFMPLRAARAFTVLALLSGTAAVVPVVVSPAYARAAPDGFADLVDSATPTVVNISTTQQVEVGRGVEMFPGLPPGHPLRDLFGNGRGKDDSDDKGDGKPVTREAQSLGSGFIIDEKGYIVTCNHVITGEDQNTVVDKISVTLSDGRKFDARLVGRDAPSDLALLKIEPTGAPIKAAKFGDSNALRVGDWLLAIGQPFGLDGTVTAGIVSALKRNVVGSRYPILIQTDASINRGNSGGPTFNANGEVVGINTSIYSPTGGNVGIGFAIPSTYATRIINQIRTSGKVSRAWLGINIQTLDDDLATANGLTGREGVVVANVNKDTPGAKAGLRPGDIILLLNGKAVKNSSELAYAVSESPIGSIATLDIVRDGKPLKISAKLEELPGGDPDRVGQPAEEPKKPARNDAGKMARQSLGISLTPLTKELRQRLGMTEKDGGVVITGVNPNSDAARKAIAAGDVLLEIDRQPVNSPEAAAAAVDAARKAGRSTVLLRVRKDGNFFFAGVKLQPLEQ